MSDSWCKPYRRNGKTLNGAAAREARLADFGGVDNVVAETREEAFENFQDAMRKRFVKMGLSND